MSLALKISLTIFSIILIFITTLLLSKNKIIIKYSLIWYFVALMLLLVVIFPQTLILLQKILGFESMVHMVIGIILGLLIIISISLTIIVSSQGKKITLLIQELSILKGKIKK